jgi:2-oxoglutarate/2-oxoacid ferredoxin oxidoreductase subunit alpha
MNVITQPLAPGAGMTDLSKRHLSDINVMVAGQGGDGSLTIASLLSSLFAHRGFHLYSTSNIASRIKGGHAAALLRASVTPSGCMGDDIDLLIAFDDEAVEIAAPSMAADGIVIFDASKGPPPEGVLADTVGVVAVPFGRLAVRDLRRDLLKNCLGFGIVSRVLRIDDAAAEASLRHRFRRLPPAAIETNVDAFRIGLEYADGSDLGEGQGPWTVDEGEREEYLMISGNEALAFGFMAAGGRFYAGYPITPASEILSWLQRYIPKYGGIAMQAEDELSAINLAIGAALTGTRSMAGSSGPGFALMLESVSHLGSAEIPLVVVDCQRAGPSTGMPTKSEQSDIGTMIHGGPGDFPRLVLAPADQGDSFVIGALATNLAQRIQGPVIVALDRSISQDSTTVTPFDLEAVTIDDGKRLTPEEVAGLEEYRRYLITEDGVSPWAVPGIPGGESLVTGNERNEWGRVSAEPVNRKGMVEKRARKIDSVLDELPSAWRWGEASAPIGLLGVGMQGPVMERAAERLVEAGVDVQVLRPRTLWPVLDETLDFVSQCKRVYVIEHNEEGQLAHLIAGAGAAKDRMVSLLKYDGQPFRAVELFDAIQEKEASSS